MDCLPLSIWLRNGGHNYKSKPQTSVFRRRSEYVIYDIALICVFMMLFYWAYCIFSGDSGQLDQQQIKQEYLMTPREGQVIYIVR